MQGHLESSIPLDPETDAYCASCNNLMPHQTRELYGDDVEPLWLHDFLVASCAKCRTQHAIWFQGNLVFSTSAMWRIVHDTSWLPASFLANFTDAGKILPITHRSAGLLLRHAFSELCQHLHCASVPLETGLTELVQRGLPNSIRIVLTDQCFSHGRGQQPFMPSPYDTRENVLTLAHYLAEIVGITGTWQSPPLN